MMATSIVPLLYVKRYLKKYERKLIKKFGVFNSVLYICTKEGFIPLGHANAKFFWVLATI
jgi:hypothetical protein